MKTFPLALGTFLLLVHCCASGAVADRFDYPMGNRGTYTAANDGDGWYVAQEFAEWNSSFFKYHLGEDWNAESGGNTDCDLPVYAVANGTIVYAGTATGWGRVLIVRHTLPGGSQVESLYGHLDSLAKTSGDVVRGETIGTIGDGSEGGTTYPCHLHLEIRTSVCPNWGQPGSGYSTTPKPVGWTDPSDFLDSHKQGSGSSGGVLAWGSQVVPIIPFGIRFVKISAGEIHSLALKSDGTVVAWGYNYSGQSTVPANLSGVVAIAAGGYHSLALKSDGTVVVWGNNSYSQSTVPENLSGVVAIAAGGAHSLALKSDGTVAAWGNNANGQSTVPANLSGVVAIAAGEYHSLALKSDGTVVAWGLNLYGIITVPAGLSGVVALAAGTEHSLALKSDGTVVAWGRNNYNDYGQSTVPANLSGVVAVAAGAAHSLALKSDGTVVAWGANSYGQSTVPANLSGVVALAAGAYQSLALKSDGTVAAWGLNRHGHSTAPANLSGVVAIAAGGGHSLALKSDGTVAAWGNNANGQSTVPANLSGVVAIAAGTEHSLALKSDGTIVAWGSNSSGQSTVPANLSGVVAIAAGAAHNLALKSDGTVVSWGSNSSGQSTVPANLSGVVAIAGAGHSLALKSDGTVVGWGANSFGQSTVPANLRGVVALAAGAVHSLALKSDGAVVAWGANSFGQSTVPANLSGVVAIAAGAWHSLALKPDGTVVAWGRNDSGQSSVPGNMSGVVALAAAHGHSLALIRDVALIQVPLIVSGPASRSAQAGANVSFAVSATGAPTMNYQWRKNGIHIANETGPALTINSVQLADAGVYSVIVWNSWGSVTSDPAQLIMLNPTDRTPTSAETGTPTIPTDNHQKVFSDGSFRSGVALDRNRMTVVLTHGWKSSPNEWALGMAPDILSHATVPAPNVVAWDWQAEASDLLSNAALKTAGQGRALGIALFNELGANYSQPIHFIGHSLGTLVNARAADYLHSDASGAKPLKAPGAFPPGNTHVTLLDEAELAPESFNAILTVLASMSAQEPVKVRVFNDDPLPKGFASADNYISAVGLPHAEAANVILTNGLTLKAPDLATLKSAANAFHAYPHQWYDASTLAPGASSMGFRWSFERESLVGMPAARSMYLQSYTSSHQDLRTIVVNDNHSFPWRRL